MVINALPDTTIINNAGQLSAAEAGASYQWLDCDNGLSPIAGATAQSFSPTVSGNYALAISANGCSDTSACRNVLIVGLEVQAQGAYRLYPNPSQGRIYLEAGQAQEAIQVELFDALGRRHWSYALPAQNRYELQLPELAGAYFLRLQNQAGQVQVWKIIKAD